MNQNDPFSAYRVKSKATSIPIQQQPQITQQQQDDPFVNYRRQTPKQETQSTNYLKEAGRIGLGHGARALETIIGLPGDIGELIQSGVLSGLEAIGGHEVSPEGKERLKEFRAPTSSELRELGKEITGGKLEPKGPIEERSQEFTQTVVSLLGPMKFRKALGIALAGSTAKEALGIGGAGKNAQEFGKLGTMFTLSMFNPRGASKYASGLYEKAKTLLPDNAVVSGEKLFRDVENLSTELRKGVKTPAKEALLKPLEEIKGKIVYGEINVDELLAAKRDINTLIKDPVLLKREQKLFNNIAKFIDDGIEKYGKENPDFLKVYRSANEAYGGIHQSQKLSRFISKHLPKKPLLSTGGAALAELLTGHPEAIGPTIGAAAAGFAGVKAFELLNRINSNPTLRKYYLNVIKDASKENSTSMLRNLNKLDLELKKLED